MKITWTKCSDRMPDKGKQVIVRDGQRRTDLETSDRLIEYKDFLCRMYGTNDRFNSELWEWTPYTPEAWEELNKYARD